MEETSVPTAFAKQHMERTGMGLRGDPAEPNQKEVTQSQGLPSSLNRARGCHRTLLHCSALFKD